MKITRYYPIWSYPVVLIVNFVRGYRMLRGALPSKRETLRAAWLYGLGRTVAKGISGKYTSSDGTTYVISRNDD